MFISLQREILLAIAPTVNKDKESSAMKKSEGVVRNTAHRDLVFPVFFIL